MTTEEKAKEVAIKHLPFCGVPITEVVDAALEIAEWKEKQMIEKAYEWLNNNAGGYLDYEAVKYGESVELDKKSLLEDFKKAMEE